jgi:hypothetical protein
MAMAMAILGRRDRRYCNLHGRRMRRRRRRRRRRS